MTIVRPAVEPREPGNSSDPIYGLSLQRFAIECRLHTSYCMCILIHVYVYIYICISVYVCIYIKSLWTVLLLKYLYRMYTYTIYFFSPLYTHMYICDLFGWHGDRVWSLIRCFRRFCFFCFKNFLHPTNINFPPTPTHPRSEMEWNKTRGPRLGCVNGYAAYTGR